MLSVEHIAAYDDVSNVSAIKICTICRFLTLLFRFMLLEYGVTVVSTHAVFANVTR